MDPVIVLLLLITFCSLSLLIVVGVIAWNTNTPVAKRRRALRRQAHFDFQNSRGTAHLKMLRQGRANLKARLTSLQKEISSKQQELLKLNQGESVQLQRALEQKIAIDHLHEIPGVGEKLRASLLSMVVNGKLSDLYHAREVIQGIGDAKQSAIHSWLLGWEYRIPAMLNDEFRQKSEIMQKFAKQRDKLNSELSLLNQELLNLDSIYEKTEAQIGMLSKVKEKDFAKALFEPSENHSIVDYYLQGAFPEWEPMPDWFKQLISLENK